MLEEADRADFTYLRKALGLRNALGQSDGNLLRHLTVLEQAGRVEIRKTFEGRKPRTWARATRQGGAVLGAEMAALRDLIGRLDTPSGKTTVEPAGAAGKGA